MRDRGSSVYFRSGQARSWGVAGSSSAAPCCGWTQGLKELSHNRVAATFKRSVILLVGQSYALVNVVSVKIAR